MNMTTVNAVIRGEIIALRVLMIAMAAVAVLTGVALLTRPLAVPVVVGIWISAAAMAFLGIWGRLPENEE
jgi:hypothetical protein